MIGGKRRGSVVPPPPPLSTAKDGGGGDVVGGKCAVVAENENENALPPVHESAKEEEKKIHKTPAKAASVNGDDSSESDDDDDDDDEEEEESEDEEEEEEESKDKDSEIEEDEADAGEEESSEKPELAEGFYYIEAVKGHRSRRGKREYRIKWRGWPESANTWEPMENLKTVPHVIANYEESLRAKAKRKRKRRNTYSFSQPRRKKPKRSPATTTTAVKRTVPAEPLKIVEETSIPAVAAESDNVVLSSGVVTDTGITYLDAGEQSNGVDLAASSGNEGTGIEDNNVIMPSDKEKGPVEEQSQVSPQEAQLTGGNVVANGSEKTESSEEALLQAGRGTGSRRRKSGPVRRFKLESQSGGGDNLENAAVNGVPTGLDVNRSPENLDSMSNDVPCKDTRKNICDIIEILKPIKYTSFMTCDTLDVCVTFLVKRSDGKEMTVDNKFLKAHCPALLVDFYEQRLRY